MYKYRGRPIRFVVSTNASEILSCRTLETIADHRTIVFKAVLINALPTSVHNGRVVDECSASADGDVAVAIGVNNTCGQVGRIVNIESKLNF